MAAKKSYNELIEGASKREVNAVHKEVREYFVKNKWRDTVSYFKIAPTVLTTIVGDIINGKRVEEEKAKKERKLERTKKREEQKAAKKKAKKAPKEKVAKKKAAKKKAPAKTAKKATKKKGPKSNSRITDYNTLTIVFDDEMMAIYHYLMDEYRTDPERTVSELIVDLVS